MRTRMDSMWIPCICCYDVDFAANGGSKKGNVVPIESPSNLWRRHCRFVEISKITNENKGWRTKLWLSVLYVHFGASA